MLRITQIKISIHDEMSVVKNQVAKKLKIRPTDILDFRIYKESIDARKRGEINFIYTVDVKLKDESKFLTADISSWIEILICVILSIGLFSLIS